MNKSSLLATIFLAGLLVMQNAAAEVNAGFVNTATVLEKAPQAQAAREKLEKEFAPREAELVDMQEAIKKLEEKRERDGAIMSGEESRKVERDLLAQQRELKRKKDEFTEDLNIRRNEEFLHLQREVAQVIVSIANEDGFDLIFESGVVYASKKVDITDKVLKKLGESANKKK